MHLKMANDLKAIPLRAQCFSLDGPTKDWKLMRIKEGETHSLAFDVVFTRNDNENPVYLLKVNVQNSDLSVSSLKTIQILSDLAYTANEKENNVYMNDVEGNPLAFVFSSSEELEKFDQTLRRILDLTKGKIPEGEFQDEFELLEQSKALISEENMLICLNLVRTKMDKTVRRGAVVKSMCFCTRRRDIHVFKGLLLFTITKYFECESDKTWDFLADLYSTINKIDLSERPVLTYLERKVYRACWSKINAGRNFKSVTYRTNCNLFGVNLPLTFPLMMEDDEIGGASLISLFKKFGENGIMTLFNAILAGKRIIFLGHNQPAVEVCETVLSACLLCSPPLRGILKRTFPYANLTDIEFLEVPGFIAGVTNPIFEQHAKWWDVLADISNGRIALNPEYEKELLEVPPEELPTTLDSEFISKVRSKIAMLFNDETIRSMFRDYTQHIVDIALGIEEFSKDNQRVNETRQNKYRTTHLQKQQFFKEYEVFFKVEQIQSYFGKSYREMRRNIRLLQVKKLSLKEVKRIYRDLSGLVKSKESLMELLSLLPESQGGLAPIAMGIFHESDSIKKVTVDLLSGLDKFEEGVRYLNNLNYFMLLHFSQTKEHILSSASNDAFDEDEKEGASIQDDEN
jgi:hypothetical protein